MKKCPYCAEEIQDEAIVCRYCGRSLSNNPINMQKATGPLTPQENQKPSIKEEPGSKILATVSIICGILGLIAYAIPLGTIAIVCGLYANSKGTLAGKTGVILGIIAIVLHMVFIFFS